MTLEAISFRPLESVDARELIALMNHRLLARHMPLLKTPFTEADRRAFIAAKRQLWEAHGFGPWAILVGGCFAGWGGLQPEAGEVDLGLVLHPDYWGHGRPILEQMLNDAFGVRGLESVIVLLPLSRSRERVMRRLGFVFEGRVGCQGAQFRQYRLTAERWRRPPCPMGTA